MPSLLDFKPLLDTYDPNAGQEDIRQGMKEAAHYASQGIEAAGERGRQREKEFQSVFDMDVSKVTDMESKNYIINKYGKLKDKNVAIFDKNKNILGYGKMSPREKIELRGDMDSLKSEAETLKILDNKLIEANDPEKKQWGREVDSEKAEAYSEAKRTGETAKMASVLNSLDNPVTGNGFVKISDVDVARYAAGQVDEARKVMETSKDIVKKQTISGGNTYDTSTAITKFGTSQEASDAIYGVMDNKETGPVLEVNLQKGDWLTDEQKRIAKDENAGTYNYPLLKYYTDNVMDTKPILEEKIETVKSVRPDKSDNSGKTVRKIELTDTGAEFGTTPISITKTVKNTDGKETIIKGGQVVSINKKDGKWTAQVIVPTAFNEEYAVFMDTMDDISKSFEDKEISEQQRDDMGFAAYNEFKSKGKWKQEDIPLGGIKKELKTGFDLKKLNVEGFDDITDDETLVPEFTVSKKVSSKDQEAINWIRKNPNDDRAKSIYDQLSESGLIK